MVLSNKTLKKNVTLSFRHIIVDEVKKVIDNLEKVKSAYDEILAKILKNYLCVSEILRSCIN